MATYSVNNITIDNELHFSANFTDGYFLQVDAEGVTHWVAAAPNGTSGTSGAAGADGDRYHTTSNTSLTIASNGTASLITNDLYLDYSIAQSIIISHDINNHMHGSVVSYNQSTGELVFDLKSKTGSGTYTSWDINLDGAVGQAGTSGTSGVNGVNGTSGINGTSGTSGHNGTSGINGTSGSSGTSGVNGTSGSSGIDGTNGINGTDGTSGSSGSSGTSGLDGTSGSSGSSGSSGHNGTSGTDGFNGINGTSGTSGVSGTSGTSGSSGQSGTSGIDGTSGLDGTSGSSGLTGTNGTSGSGSFGFATYSISGAYTQNLASASIISLSLSNDVVYDYTSATTSTPYFFMVDAGTHSFKLGTVSSYKVPSTQTDIAYGATGINGLFKMSGIYDGINMNIDYIKDYQNSYTPGLDPDAEAFLTAAGITDPTITSAIDTLVIGLKADGVWSKMFIIYPLVGGDATKHSYNLKDPTTYQADFNGGWVHSANGILGNGTNTNANTTWIPSSGEISLNDWGFGYYSRVGGLGDSIDMGCLKTGGDQVRIDYYQRLQLAGIDSLFDPGHVSERITNAQSTTDNFIIITRTSSSSAKAYSNGSVLSTATAQSASDLPNVEMVFGDVNLTSPPTSLIPSENQYAFLFCSVGLTDAEAGDINTLVQAFQTTLGRQIVAPTNYLFDEAGAGGAYLAYSTRLLSSTYSGNCMEVRRSSDSATQNIGFVDGLLDTASLTTFLSGSTGSVVTWYDQTGSGRNAVSSIAEPIIAISGTIQTKNSIPSIYFSGNDTGQAFKFNNDTLAQPSTVFMLAQSDATTSDHFMDGPSRQLIGNVTNLCIYAGGGLVNTGIDVTTFNLMTAIFNGESSFIQTNDSTSASGNAGSAGLSVDHLIMSEYSGGGVSSTTYGFVSEFIVYPSDMTSNLTTVRTNINEYFTVY